MSAKHDVRLPHPHREGYTVGDCRCGWNVAYRWGGHGDAADEAREHIRQAAHAEPVEASEASGLITVMEGRSL